MDRWTDSNAVWAAAWRAMDRLPDGGLNIAHEAAARHARGASGRRRVAVRYLRPDGGIRELTYAELDRQSARLAAALERRGLMPGDRVAWLGGSRPELFVLLLATLRMRAVFCPLFAAFGPEPLATRLQLAGARAVATTAALHRRRFAGGQAPVPSPDLVLILDDEMPANGAGVLRYRDCLAGAPDPCPIPPTAPDDPALLHFTSGTTGRPKGVMHVHEAVVAHRHTARAALGLRSGDVFWCTADPGWVTGTSYGVIAPLASGATVVVDGGEFDPQRWLDILDRQRVAVWYTAPTALRMIRRVGPELLRGRRFPDLRLVASVGEPMDAATVLWGERTLGVPIRDTWWQTETGAIMIANHPGAGVRPGAMGKPLPGVEAGLVERLGGGGLRAVAEAGREGEIALRTPWPSMFRGYLAEPDRYAACFRQGWYLSGDLARRDRDGWFHFVGRSDDLIKSAGHLIGPAEVEAVLLAHPAVADAAVVGLPDPLTGQRVQAYVVTAAGVARSPELARRLIAHARRRLGAPVAPRGVEFRRSLPRTRSGKIARRLLRARAAGEAPGDLSTIIDGGTTSGEEA